MKDTITIALVDDDRLVTSLLADFLEHQGIQVLFCSENGKECIDTLRTLTVLPDLIILDLRMKEMDGLKTLEIISSEFPLLKNIVLSSYYSISTMGFMLKAGANAFLPKGIFPEKLLRIIQEVNHNDFYFTSEQVNALREQLPNNSVPPPINADYQLLSKREKEVLELICRQYTAKEIGEKLYITQRTVEGHRNNLLLKTGVKNTAGLVVYAIQNNVVDPDTLLLY